MVVCSGGEDACGELFQSIDAEVPLLLDPQNEISELFGVARFPVIVVLDAKNRVRGYGYPSNAPELEEFIESALRELNSKSFQAA
jgi:hypothetical protein